MACKGYLQHGDKIDGSGWQAIEVVKQPLFSKFGSHTCLYRPNKTEKFLIYILDLALRNTMQPRSCKHMIYSMSYYRYTKIVQTTLKNA